MNKYIKYVGVSLSLSAILALSGCGGGSSSLKDKQTEISKFSTINGKAVDGYLKFSTVCLDMNSDGFCQPTEPFTLTDSDGDFNLTVTEAQQNDANYSKAQLVVYSGQDSDRPAKDFIGKLKAPNDGTGQVNVTPITTLVSAYIQKAGVSDISKEKIKAAKTKVATVLGINVDKIDADPRANGGDKDLVNATLQLQYAVNAMVTATGVSDDKKDDEAENIFAAFAAGLDNVTETGDISNAIADIIEKAPADKLDAKAVKAKKVAKTSATNIQKVMNAFQDSNSLQEALTQAVVTQAKLIKQVEDANFSNETVTFADIDFNNTIDFEEEATKIYLGDLGVDVSAEDFNASAYKDKVSFDMDLDELKKSIGNDNTGILDKINGKLKDINDKIAQSDGIAKMGTLRTDVEGLFTPTKSASVGDAKNMFAQLREAGTSFIDMDIENQENNTSTIVGSQAKLITDKMQPAVENIADDFESSATAMDNSMQAFNKSLETNFGTVLGTETTDGAISTRLNALSDLVDAKEESGIDTHKNDWSVSSSLDTLSHTYSKTGDTVTEILTLNGTTITIVSTEDGSGDNGELTSVSTSGDITLKGTGYDLKVTSLSFDENGKVSLKASGTISGEDSSTMTLSALEISFDFDKNKEDTPKALSNIEATFDGTIVSSGRTLQGQLNISESSKIHTLEGSYTGLSNEPSFEGTITVKIDLDDVKTVAEDNGNTVWIGDYAPLVMVDFNDGTKSLMTSYTMIDKRRNENAEDVTDYNLTTQSGKSIACTKTNHDIFNNNNNNDYIIGYTQEFSCTNGSLKIFTSDGDKILTANFSDGTSAIVSDVWSNLNNSTYSMNIYFKNDAQLKTITSITEANPKNIDEFDGEATFEGLISHGDKKINATFGVKSIGQTSDISIFAKDVNITDGTSYIKMDALNVVTKKDHDDEDNNYWHSEFESFTYYYFQDNNDNNDENPIGSISAEKLLVSLVDTDNKALTFDADFFISNTPSGDMEVKFNGIYTYSDTKFTGIIDANGNENTNAASFDIIGKIEANGFEPFSIAAAGSVSSDETIDAYALFTRGAEYKLGLHVQKSTTKDSIEYKDTMRLADSNGVLGSYDNTWYNDERDDTNDVYNFTNKDGAPLATYGKDSNHNDWEIKYSDNTAESLF